jgi:hypothetical protein
VQTEVTYLAVAPCLATNASVSASFIRSIWPAPPGMQITSSGGQSLNVVVGTIEKPASVFTGSSVFQTMCRVAPGVRARTWAGPVASSWVTLGKIRMPMFMRVSLRRGKIAVRGDWQK